jgi:hypothetical protein
MMTDATRTAFDSERAALTASGRYALDAGRLYHIETRENVASGRYSVKVANGQIDAFRNMLAEFEPVSMTPSEARAWVGILAEYAAYALGLADAACAA